MSFYTEKGRREFAVIFPAAFYTAYFSGGGDLFSHEPFIDPPLLCQPHL